MRALMRAALDLCFPQFCSVCAAPTDKVWLCRSCLAAVPSVRAPICPVCGVGFSGAGSDHPCSHCLQEPPPFDRARACARYTVAQESRDGLATAIHRFKYGRDVTLGPALGSFLASRCPFDEDYDLLAPVPLHRDRLRWRGFNQAVLLGRSLARRWSTRLDPHVLVRARPTPPQVGLSLAERKRNVTGAFAVARPAAVRDRCILLLDDVFTTGATVNECARALRSAGARQVDVLVLARATLN